MSLAEEGKSLSVAGFVQFVNEQRADELIDHDEWKNCAVGKYVKATSPNVVTTANNLGFFNGRDVDSFRLQLQNIVIGGSESLLDTEREISYIQKKLEIPVTLYNLLGSPTRYNLDISTYGKLAAVLNSVVKRHKDLVETPPLFVWENV